MHAIDESSTCAGTLVAASATFVMSTCALNRRGISYSVTRDIMMSGFDKNRLPATRPSLSSRVARVRSRNLVCEPTTGLVDSRWKVPAELVKMIDHERKPLLVLKSSVLEPRHRSD